MDAIHDEEQRPYRSCVAGVVLPLRHRAYVMMDIAETPDGLKIVEVNNLDSDGWYKADMEQLVMALEGMA